MENLFEVADSDITPNSSPAAEKEKQEEQSAIEVTTTGALSSQHCETDMTNPQISNSVACGNDDEDNIGVGMSTNVNNSSSSTILNRNKRINNFPFDNNPSWEKFESESFCMFRVLPDDLNLTSRSFALGLFIKHSDCRFNCGDIVSTLHHKSVVFLGVRFAKTKNAAADLVLLYFFPFEAGDQHYEGMVTYIYLIICMWMEYNKI